MPTSAELKISLFHYLRFSRKYPMVASEVSYWKGGIADMLAADGKKIFEIEVKVDKRDFINDFNKTGYGRWWKKDNKKHILLEEGVEETPNLFSFCVPEKLVDFAKEELEKRQSKYGLIAYDDRNGLRIPSESCLTVVISPKYLHKNYSMKIEGRIIRRMSSELAREYMKHWRFIHKR